MPKKIKNPAYYAALHNKIVAAIADRPGCSGRDIATAVNMDPISLNPHLVSLQEQGRIAKQGKTNMTRWTVVDPGQEWTVRLEEFIVRLTTGKSQIRLSEIIPFIPWDIRGVKIDPTQTGWDAFTSNDVLSATKAILQKQGWRTASKREGGGVITVWIRDTAAIPPKLGAAAAMLFLLWCAAPAPARAAAAEMPVVAVFVQCGTRDQLDQACHDDDRCCGLAAQMKDIPAAVGQSRVLYSIATMPATEAAAAVAAEELQIIEPGAGGDEEIPFYVAPERTPTGDVINFE